MDREKFEEELQIIDRKIESAEKRIAILQAVVGEFEQQKGNLIAEFHVIVKGDKLLITHKAFDEFYGRHWGHVDTWDKCVKSPFYDGWHTGGILVAVHVTSDYSVSVNVFERAAGTHVSLELAIEMRKAYLEKYGEGE